MAALDARQQAAATRIQSLIRGREGRKKAVVKRKALVQQRFTLLAVVGASGTQDHS